MRDHKSTSPPAAIAHPILLGVLGVLCFSATLPATKVADPVFGIVPVGVSRAVPAAAIAALVLRARRQPLLPPRALLRPLALVVGGVVIGFPLLTAAALGDVDSVHGAVITGLIPAATAGAAVLIAGERPGGRYWVVLGAGIVAVVAFAQAQGAGRLRSADLLLLAAVVVAGVGYAQGGALARRHGGWRVICWALIAALPLTVPATVVAVAIRPPSGVTAGSVVGFGYVAVVSMCLGFFAWYEGLARGGVARIGRLQLAQPALTMVWSVVLLGEHVNALTVVTAGLVVGLVAVGRDAGAAGRGAAVAVPEEAGAAR